MVSPFTIARLCAISSLIALLIVSAAGAAPLAQTSARSTNGEVIPGVLIPLYASQQNSFTRVAAPQQRMRSANAATINITYNSFSAEAQGEKI